MTWPIAAQNYGSYEYFKREVGVFLKYGADFNAWTHEQDGLVDSAIQSGLKRFYFPPPVENTERYRWSFLTPVAALSTASGTGVYDLPEDFNGLLRAFSFPVSGASRNVGLVNEWDMRGMFSLESAANSAPKFAAIRPKASTGSAVQQWEVLFYPVPDAAYTLTYRYQINPPTIDSANSYPFGGTGHAETILESMLAVAEDRLTGTKGRHWEQFQERLIASILLDSQTDLPSDGAWELLEPPYGTYGWLLREVGAYMEFGYDPDAWTYGQERRVNSLVQRGVRQFYSPLPVPLSGKDPEQMHEWSFLKSLASFPLVSGTYSYDLSADFGTIASDVIYSLGSNELRIQMVSEGTLRSLQAKAISSGAPKYCAIRPKSFVSSVPHAWEMLFYPTPDAPYTVSYRYNIVPPDLTSAEQYPLGGPIHAEGLLASCLAVAELSKTGELGAYNAQLAQRLSASLAIDRRSLGEAQSDKVLAELGNRSLVSSSSLGA